MKVKNRPGRGRARLLSIVLSVFLLLTLLPAAGMRVNAEGELTVSIHGTTAETKYEGYRLLTSITGADGAVTYSLNDKYKDIVLQAATDASGNTVATLEQLLTFLNTHSGSGNSTALEDAKIRLFADKVYAGVKDMGEDHTFQGGDNSLDLDQTGYWLLGQKTGTDITTSILLPLTRATAEINVKQSTPEVHKKVMENSNTATYQDAADYSVGENVPFMITGTISDQIKNFSSYTYKFTDIIPKGFDLDADSIAVQIEKVQPNEYAKGINAKDKDKVTLNAGTDYKTNTATKEDGTTTLTVDVTGLLKLVQNPDSGVAPGDTVVVTYNAKLNQNAVIGSQGNVNTVKLTYSNNPYSGDTHETTERNAKVYTYALSILKTGRDGNSLSGAEFTLLKKTGEEYTEIAKLGPNVSTTSNGFVGELSLEADGEVPNARFNFNGLDAASYKIIESKVPDGYKKADDIEFTIATNFENQNSSDAALASLNVSSVKPEAQEFKIATDGDGAYTGLITTTIHNSSDSELILPRTGGYGVFILIGGVAVFAIGVFMLIRRRSQNAE
ncbi:fimbrial isopeptide formation D2 domain-containing protein [Lachnospiraceae bacterium NK3A20]|nr:fimbrial isopeptide formation D2 domain-containing protein [Lachnospiraceae bacterium NK3A20]